MRACARSLLRTMRMLCNVEHKMRISKVNVAAPKIMGRKEETVRDQRVTKSLKSDISSGTAGVAAGGRATEGAGIVAGAAEAAAAAEGGGKDGRPAAGAAAAAGDGAAAAGTAGSAAGSVTAADAADAGVATAAAGAEAVGIWLR